MLNVLLDSVIYGLQTFGGITNYWQRLSNGLVSSSEIQCEFLLPRQAYNQLPIEAFRGSRFITEKKPTFISRYLPIEKSNCDVFHTSYYRLIRKCSGRRVVTAYDFTYEKYRTGLPRIVHSAQKKAALMGADKIICISESTKHDCMDFLPDFYEDRIEAIPLGVDFDFFNAATSNLERTYKELADQKIILYVGNRSGYKRFDLAVGALQLRPDYTLGVVGPPLSKDESQMLQQRLGDSWRYFGFVPRKDLPALYASAYAFIFPSEYEGFGLPILEALSAGCPVILSNRSSFPEVAGTVGFFAESQDVECYAEALDRLDAAERVKIVKDGFLQAKKFSWEETISRTVNAYIS